MKVLIVDDEIKVCNLLRNLVDWKALGLEIAGVANDGKSACEMANELHPDIVITDIRMPGYSGMELIERIQKTAPDTHFIIISGHRQFEYASQAIKYGVEDYLLKPLKQSEMERILKKIVNRHRQVLTSRNEQEGMLRRMSQSIETLQEHFLKLLMDKDAFVASRITMEQANERYHLGFSSDYFQIVLIKAFVLDEIDPDATRRLLERKLRSMLETQLSTGFTACICGLADGYVICLLNGEHDALKQLPLQMGDMMNSLLSLKELFHATDITVALSGIGRAFDSLPGCVHQARVTMMQRFFSRPGALLTYSAAYESMDVNLFLDARARSDFKKKITHMDAPSVCEFIRSLQHQMVHSPNVSGWAVGQVCQMLYQLLVNTMMENGVLLSETFLAEAKEKQQAARTVTESFSFLEKACIASFEQWRQSKEAEETAPIRKAKSYIHAHYAQSITLSDISAEVGLNPSYFSSLFKRETGVSFLDYVMEVRIDVAKELLVETNMSISEIAENVGYNDIKYFYKRFRQSTGVSLKEYRKLYQ